MAISYADKYSQIVDEKFRLQSQTADFVNGKYDFIGVKTVKVYNYPTAAMNDYNFTGTDRYGSPAELEGVVQEMTLSKDRSFTFVIDRMNHDGTMMTAEAGSALSRQIEQVIVPEIDTYRLNAMATGVGVTNGVDTAPTKTNAYELFLKGCAVLDENKVPRVGRVAFVSPTFYSLIQQDNAFMKNGNLSQEMLIKGVVGSVNGVEIRVVPASYLPANKDFILTHKEACVSPVKLSDYKIHDNPPGINGWLVEGRVVYDCFVLTNKAKAIYVQGHAAA